MHFKCNHLAKPTGPYCRAIPPGFILRRIRIVITGFGYITAEVFCFCLSLSRTHKTYFSLYKVAWLPYCCYWCRKLKNHGNGISPRSMMLIPHILLF